MMNKASVEITKIREGVNITIMAEGDKKLRLL